jgi:nitroreductase
MNVSEAVRARRSIRAFLDKPVPPQLLREALEPAARAPSGGNLQPWRLYLLAGPPLARLPRGDATAPAVQANPDPPEYHIYPEMLGEPYRTSRYAVGEAMYELVGIKREDKQFATLLGV